MLPPIPPKQAGNLHPRDETCRPPAGPHAATARADAVGEARAANASLRGAAESLAGGGAESLDAGAATLPPERVHASLRYAIKDGVAWALMTGLGERYVHPFIILGGSTALALAAISILPTLGDAIMQWLAANAVDRFGRRKAIIVWCARLQALIWAPICVAVLLPPPYGYLLMLVAFVLSVACDSSTVPAWNSVMGDLVPADRRGRYFSLRNALVGPTIMAAFLFGGWWLDYCDRAAGLARWGASGKSFGFVALFFAAGLARLASARFLNRMDEPPYHRQPSDSFSLLDFLRRAPRADFGRFVFYRALMSVATGCIGPFFAWYLLKDLRLSTMHFAIVGTIQMLVYFGCQPLWGWLADRVGNKRVLVIGGIGGIGVPLLLLLADNLYGLVILQIYDGVVWSACDLAASNYLFDIVTPAKRARCVAYATVLCACGAALGILTGALIMQFAALPVDVLGATIRHPFTIVLLLSTALRILPNVLLLGSFREWRLKTPTHRDALRAGGPGEGPPV